MFKEFSRGEGGKGQVFLNRDDDDDDDVDDDDVDKKDDENSESSDEGTGYVRANALIEEFTNRQYKNTIMATRPT